MKPASVGARVGAAIIDIFIVSTLGWLVSIPFLKHFDPSATLMRMQTQLQDPMMEPDQAADLVSALMPMMFGLLILVIVVAFLTHAYYVYFESTSGQTPGKKMLGLRVVTLDGQRITRGQAIYREMVRWYVDALFVLPAFIAMYSTPRRQRVGDIFAKTMVIETSSTRP